MSQLKLFNLESIIETIRIQNGEYIYDPFHFNEAESTKYFNTLLNEVNWKQENMQMYGRVVKFPRLTAWYGENDKKYSFSGITLDPVPWTKSILAIKNSIESKFGKTFNSVLLNLYNSGSDSISWHTDAEEELGKNPVIASVSLGANRMFQLRHRETQERIDLELQNGSLLIMQGEFQHYWKHQVPKTKRAVGKRINLTFRNII
jgi:alkylated DNA repair dioxygenase AlkB